MSRCGVSPILRRVTWHAFFGVLAVSITVATAQAQSSHDFASSSEGVVTSDASGTPAAPTPAGGGAAGQASGSYGYHEHNWASHLTFEGGGGFNAPTSDSSDYITWGGNFTLGAGYRFNKYVSGLVEYQFIDDKLPGALIAETGANGGNAHIWSFTVDPVIDLMPGRTNDVYVTGGGGFYRKVTNFTDPQAVEYCSYFYCSIGTQNEVVGHFSSNQGGWSVGAGFTHKLGGRFNPGEKTKLFAEARYLVVDTPAVLSNPNGLGTTSVAAETKLVPVTFGVRF
jgi:hypothetical protein